jgi:membrane-associated protease RseP (regulator of RpoE activity)
VLEHHPRLRLVVVHGGLFLTTCLTTTAFGGVAFAATLMGILLAHEMGHFVVARRHRVEVSLPYFIPLPFGMGTMGAIIRMRQAVRSRDALVDIGAAGPLAGLAVALPCLVWGLRLSNVGPLVPGGMLEGNSLAYLGLKYAVKGAVLPGGGRDVFLHPIAFASWVGLLVTMINLIPVGQLDGGHIAYGYFGERHDRASATLHAALAPVGAVVLLAVAHEARAAGLGGALAEGAAAAAPWFVWTIMLGIMRRMTGGRWHPPVGAEPLGARGRFVARLVLVVFVLIFVPIPFRAAVP